MITLKEHLKLVTDGWDDVYLNSATVPMARFVQLARMLLLSGVHVAMLSHWAENPETTVGELVDEFEGAFEEDIIERAMTTLIKSGYLRVEEE